MTATTYARTASVLILAGVAAGLAFAETALAQTAYPTDRLPTADVFNDFVVGPGKVELTLAPGESRTVDIMVSNRMGDERRFAIEVEDMRGSDDPEQAVVLLGDDRGPYSLRDYLSFPEREFVLPHGTRARIPVTVRAPADAAPGGYYGSTLFTTTTHRPDDPAGAQSGAAVVSRIGVLFFITVPGATTHEGSLERVGIRGDRRFFLSTPITFQLLFRNTGNIHLNLFGQIEIRNMLGRTVAVVRAEPWFALPQSLRLREIEWDQRALIGRYTAVASVNRGYGGIVDTRTVSFWVLPVVPIAIALAGLFAFVSIIWFIVRRFEIRRK